MAIDFSRLVSSADRASVEPRDIFMALPNKDKSYGYPRDVQTEVWKQWFDRRNEKNIIIKMNTGSGKTTVGLTILQSCLNEGKGPAMYVVPDNYLVSQVCSEAQKLGIRVAYDEYGETGLCIKKGEEDYFFTNKKAIFVTSIHKLVNGKSVFGLRANGGNVQIGSIIIDDVHACMNIIEQQYTIRIKPGSPVYSQIVQLFSRHQELKKSQTFYNITENKDPNSNELIPFWIWQKDCEEIRRLLLAAATSDDDVKDITLFNLPLLTDCWQICNCVLTANSIEITPKGIPISKIASFEQAERRIFMSATLSDDSVFVSTMGLKENDVSNIITPEKANDIGERLLLFPKHLNASLDDNAIKNELAKIALKYNVVVIVPSFERALFWKDLSEQIPIQTLSSRDKNIESGIQLLKQGGFKGITILVNKYDGVDLPEDACRFLVIDGLPTMRSEYDITVHNINPNDKRICRELIQKIEQGMGRGVRSNSDYCVVVLMGSKLANVLVNQKSGDDFFSKATLEQYNISKQLWDQLMSASDTPTIEEIFELADYVLKRDPNWISTSKNMLASVEYDRTANIDRTAVATHKAFDKACIGRYDEAFDILEDEKNQNTTLDNKSEGFLMQQMAEYKNFSNPVQAQEILLSGLKLNPAILRPINGVQYGKLSNFSGKQGANVAKFISDNKFGSLNNYLIYVDSVLEDLVFRENTADSFEGAIKTIASILGIKSSRPEKEGASGGPDNLWAIDNSRYFVIECKNGVKPSTTEISKSDCAQLLSSIQWFENLYTSNNCRCYPIMIHRVTKFEKQASPDPRIRIMTIELLEKFKTAVSSFTKNIASDKRIASDFDELQRLLTYYKLTGEAIIDAYTTRAR